jgi:hypothetical protein
MVSAEHLMKPSLPQLPIIHKHAILCTEYEALNLPTLTPQSHLRSHRNLEEKATGLEKMWWVDREFLFQGSVFSVTACCQA